MGSSVVTETAFADGLAGGLNPRSDLKRKLHEWCQAFKAKKGYKPAKEDIRGDPLADAIYTAFKAVPLECHSTEGHLAGTASAPHPCEQVGVKPARRAHVAEPQNDVETRALELHLECHSDARIYSSGDRREAMEARGEDSGASSDSHVSATPTKPGSLRSCLRDTAASGGMRATSPSRAPPGLPSPQGSSNPHLRRAPARVALAERLAPNRPAERKPEEGASTAGSEPVAARNTRRYQLPQSKAKLDTPSSGTARTSCASNSTATAPSKSSPKVARQGSRATAALSGRSFFSARATLGGAAASLITAEAEPAQGLAAEVARTSLGGVQRAASQHIQASALPTSVPLPSSGDGSINNNNDERASLNGIQPMGGAMSALGDFIQTLPQLGPPLPPSLQGDKCPDLLGDAAPVVAATRRSGRLGAGARVLCVEDAGPPDAESESDASEEEEWCGEEGDARAAHPGGHSSDDDDEAAGHGDHQDPVGQFSHHALVSGGVARVVPWHREAEQDQEEQGAGEGAGAGGMETFTEADLTGLRVTELKEKLAAAGKLVSGTKATLIARLLGTEPTLSCSNKGKRPRAPQPPRAQDSAPTLPATPDAAGEGGAAGPARKRTRRASCADGASTSKAPKAKAAPKARPGVVDLKPKPKVYPGRDNFVRNNLRGGRGGARKFIGNPGGLSNRKRKGGFNARFGGGRRLAHYRGSSRRGFKGGGGGGGEDGDLDQSQASVGVRKGSCFKCGQPGHWASQCTNVISSLDLEVNGSESCAKCGKPGHVAADCSSAEINNPDSGQAEASDCQGSGASSSGVGRMAAASFAKNRSKTPGRHAHSQGTKLEQMKADLLDPELIASAWSDPTDESLVAVLQKGFGHDAFRPGQVDVIRRVLAGQPTLAILPTGAGKSLCYQLPALLQPGITVVVSPLLALMEDQLRSLPKCLPGGIISSFQRFHEAQAALEDMRAGIYKVVFVSPERLQVDSFLNALREVPGGVSLACVDEAHCVSEWSHNFRPAYYRLGSLLRSGVGMGCILGLTATATRITRNTVADALGIPPEGVMVDAPMRSNLRLFVSREHGREQALLSMLQNNPYKKIKSIIVYCHHQYQADNLANMLYQNGVSAMSYHAGKIKDERRRIQMLFMGGKVKVIVATIAFGMGVDKSDIGAVINFNLPRSPEEYVQQIGRAGRNGELAFCHMFLDDGDIERMRSLVRSEGVDVNVVQRFLAVVFHGGALEPEQALKCDMDIDSTNALVSTHFGQLDAEALSQKLDMKQTVMETLLSYLEADRTAICLEPGKLATEDQAASNTSDDQSAETEGYVLTIPGWFATCEVTFHGATPDEKSMTSPLVAAIVKVAKQPVRNGRHVCSTVKLAREIKARVPAVLQARLQELSSDGTLQYELRDKGPSFLVMRNPPGSKGLVALARNLATRLDNVEKCQIGKLEYIYETAKGALSVPGAALARMSILADKPPVQNLLSSHRDSLETNAITHLQPFPQTDDIRGRLARYFDDEMSSRPPNSEVIQKLSTFLRADVKVFLRTHALGKVGETGRLTGRAVARIFHGIGSPTFPAHTWSRNPFWGRHAAVDFDLLKRIASEEVIMSL